jgi:hypothetical protein
MKPRWYEKITVLAVIFTFAASLNAWPWSPKPVDRPIDAVSSDTLEKSLQTLKKDLSDEDFQTLMSSIAWITFYEGTMVGVGGRYDPDLSMARTRSVLNGKSSKQVCEYAVKLAKDAPRVMEGYRHWIAAGAK